MAARLDERAAAPGIRRVTRDYEEWLRRQTAVIARDLRRKHAQMASSPFAFLRATYYRWAQLWPLQCGDLAKAPIVTSVGDLHIENFGTWRDAEGRLAWGVNDFDEAAPLPYTNDLVRLTSSAFLALREDRLALSQAVVCRAILSAYHATLCAGGRPLILAEGHRKLRERILDCLIEPTRFWGEKLGSDLRRTPRPSKPCREALMRALPAGSTRVRIRARVAGLGGLGRARFVAIAEWTGSRVAREARAFVPSAALWASEGQPPQPTTAHVAKLIAGSVRSRDPFLQMSGGWTLRRLAPESGKIRLATLGQPVLEVQLLEFMGSELANVHLATPRATREILRDLGRRGSLWLGKAAERMARCVEQDHAAW